MTGELQVECIKTAYPSFKEGNQYTAKWSNKVLTSAPQLVVTDDTGYDGHIIAEGYLKTDEWFGEHFKITGNN